jgi:hypothetical protein
MFVEVWRRIGQSTRLSAMTGESEVKTKGDVLPGLIECLERLAADSTASPFNRFEAIELLLRLAIGPRRRPADRIDIDASRHARIALATAASFLDRTMKSNDDRARIRLHAASLASLVAKVTETSPARHFCL